MTYLSHPVHRMREAPAEGEDVTLRVTSTDDTDAEALADRIAGTGTVEEHLRFGALRVTVPQASLDSLCSVEGIESVETAEILGVEPGDAGEDVGADR